MPRPKGSKNKTLNEKIEDLIEDVNELDVDAGEKAEAISELEDLLDSPNNSEKKLVGYHPISGEEVWL